MSRALRFRAVELSARFANIGEDPGISVARAEVFYDFLANGSEKRLCFEPRGGSSTRPRSGSRSRQSSRGRNADR